MMLPRNRPTFRRVAIVVGAAVADLGPTNFDANEGQAGVELREACAAAGFEVVTHGFTGG